MGFVEGGVWGWGWRFLLFSVPVEPKAIPAEILAYRAKQEVGAQDNQITVRIVH
jgi:hypothetical protein